MTRDERWLLEEKYGGRETAGFEKDRRRLERGEPLAYVIGWQPFLGLNIRLDSKPLIPRVETEWWVGEMLAEIKEGMLTKTASDFHFLDLCAGSGAIGCAALARLPDIHVSFGEKELRHEATIRENVRQNGLDAARAHIRIGDLFAPFGGIRFDAIAANPPYIPESRGLARSVAAWEPAEALRAGSDGLDLIRRIASGLPSYLTPRGIAWIECDSAHAEDARNLFIANGLHAEIHVDQYGAKRVIAASRASSN